MNLDKQCVNVHCTVVLSYCRFENLCQNKKLDQKKKKAMKNLMKKYFRAVFKPSNSEIHF